MELSEKSKAIVERAKQHQRRCQMIELLFGSKSGLAFHLRWKGDPGSEEARQEFERLVEAMSN